MGRARQVINLPRPDAEVEVVFERGPTGVPVALKVVAQSRTLLEPEGFMVTFDGLVLSGENARYPLPDFDPQQVHIISAEVFFPGGAGARTDVSFGGPYSGQVVTELTAVAVVMEGRRRPVVADFEGVLRVRGEVLDVTAVERPGGRVSPRQRRGNVIAVTGILHRDGVSVSKSGAGQFKRHGWLLCWDRRCFGFYGHSCRFRGFRCL